MSVILNNYIIEEETLLKAMILSRGIEFSQKTIEVSVSERAKLQNLVYNIPINATNSRPQELIINNLHDGYAVVVSCVASNSNSTSVCLETDENGNLVAYLDNKKIDNVEIHFVKEPEYYSEKLQNGESVKKYVSACGLDELNIIPWKGCAISRICKFCGINNFITQEDLSAHRISKDKNEWYANSRLYLDNLQEAVSIAVKSNCYKEHAHIILIAGNLDNNCLDFEANVMAEITERINPIIQDKTNEGVVVVITPPRDFEFISKLKDAGVSKVVFNIEAITKQGFEKYCPGKADLGYQFFIDRLKYAVDIFGRGNVWTNLVFGLERKEETLKKCELLIHDGVVISANVLHYDKGNSIDCNVPSLSDIIDFYYKLEKLNHKKGFLPFYCAKALRTSLSNEAHDSRIKEKRQN